jgi:hypothetical protein
LTVAATSGSKPLMSLCEEDFYLQIGFLLAQGILSVPNSLQNWIDKSRYLEDSSSWPVQRFSKICLRKKSQMLSAMVM